MRLIRASLDGFWATNVRGRFLEVNSMPMANLFYRERVDQHLHIGIRALELLREQGVDQVHSRKLRSFAEVAFQ